jgi:hypothetical protein
MGDVVSVMASSHAFTFVDPEKWDGYRQANREYYQRIYGVMPEAPAGVTYEDLPECRARFAKVSAAIDELREGLARQKPDALIVVGDDQNEHFKDLSPQIVLYTGSEVTTTENPEKKLVHHACDAGLASVILQGLLDREFDVTACRSLPDNHLFAHAFTPILERVTGPLSIPVILMFVNSIHFPALSPKRCYELGVAIRQIVKESDKRVSLYGSGGLSHFTAGYPWRHYRGSNTWGAIETKFDRQALSALERGDAASLAKLSSDDLLQNGEIELRSWITVAGALGEEPMQTLAYEPIYRACMAMGVARWQRAE